LPVANVGTITINPSANLPGDTLCQVVVATTDTTDADAFDPPNQLDGNFDGAEGPSFGFSFQTQSVANDDAYTVTPHLTYTSSLASLSVRDNDNPTTTTVVNFSSGVSGTQVPNGTNFITADGAGGRVVMNPDGTFIFYPDAGDNNTSGTATFSYSITGGDTALVTLTFEAEEFVWFVDGSGACTVGTGTNLGTQACPATDVPTVAGVDTANDVIFVADGNYNCGITLTTGEWVIGDGSSSTLAALVASRVTPVAGSNFAPYNTFSGTDPVLTSAAADCFTLSTGNTIRGLTIANTGNFAGIVGTNYGTFTVEETTINGTGQILNLDTGTVNAVFDSLASTSSDNSFATLRVTNSTVNFTSLGGVNITGTVAGVESILLTQNSGLGFSLVNTSVTKASTGRAVVLGDGNIQSAGISLGTVNITTSAGTALETNRQTGAVAVTGGTINATGGAAINVINAVGNTTPLAMTLTSTSATGGTVGGIVLSGATGSLNAGGGALNTAGNTISVLNSSLAFTYSGSATNSTAGNYVVNIDAASGSVTLNGSVSATNPSLGVIVQNSGGTITFSTLTLGTSVARLTNTPLTLTNNGGTVDLGTVSIFTNNVTAMNATNNNGTINSTTGEINATNSIAINIDGPAGITTLGMTLTSVSSTNSATNGILIQDTDGSFTVTGDGNATTHTNGAGGTISNTTGVAVALNNTSNITLNDMVINNTGNHGFSGTNVNGLVLDNVDMSNIGNNDNENALAFMTGAGANLIGTVVMDNVTINNVADNMIYIENFAGNLNLTVTNSIFNDTISTTVCGGGNCNGAGFMLRADGTSSMDIVMDNNQFTNLDGIAISANPEGNSAAQMEIDITNNIFTAEPYGGPSHTNNGEVAISLRNAQGNSIMRFDVNGNQITNYTGELALGVIEVEAGDFTVNNGAIRNNTINHAYDGNAIQIFVDGNPTVVGNPTNPLLNVSVTNNTIPAGSPILGASLLAQNNGAITPTQNGSLNLIATNNNFLANATGGSRRTLTVNVRDRQNACLDIRNNTLAAGTGGTQPSVNLSYSGTGIVNLQGMGGAGDANAIAYLGANNTLAVAAISGPNNNVTSAVCTLPSYP